MIAVIVMTLVYFFRIIMSVVPVPVAISAMSVNMIIGFISKRTISGCFMVCPLVMPARFVIFRSWVPVMGK